MAEFFQKLKNFYLRIVSFTAFCSGFHFLVILFIYKIFGEILEPPFLQYI